MRFACYEFNPKHGSRNPQHFREFETWNDTE